MHIQAKEILSDIYSRRRVIDAYGVEHKLHSEITPDEGDLINRVIKANNCQRSLEIGCAFGLSSLYICDALSTKNNPHHTIIDPFQYSEWFGVGVNHLKQAEITFFELIEQPSEFALPDLLRDKKKYDFALIDGFHTFDQTMIDFYYVNRMLDPGGIVLLDDLQLPAVRKVARWVAKLGNYKVVDTAGQANQPPSWRRKTVENMMKVTAKVLPSSFVKDNYGDALFHPDTDLGLISEMVAFQKTGPDVRSTHSFEPF